MGIESIRYSLVLELPHDFGQLVWHGQTDSSGVLNDGDAFVGAVEENHRRAQDASAAYHMDIEDIRHAYQGKDKHLLTDALETNGRGQVSLHDGAKDSRHIIRDDKCQERIHEAVEVTEIFAKSRSFPGRLTSCGNMCR